MMIKSNNKFVVLCIILVVALCSGHAFQTIIPSLPWLVLPVAAAVVLWSIHGIHNGKKSGKDQIAVLVFTVMIGATFLQGLGRGASFYGLMLCNILAGYGISRMYSFKQIAHCHVRCMTIITAIAIVGYLLLQNTTLLNALPSMTNVNNVEYRVSGIFNYIKTVPNRNCGMFWEPGLFATHLIISIVFEIMYEKKPNIVRLILFSAGIFTANSSAGFALWILCVMLLFLKNAKLSSNPVAAAISIIAVSAGALLIINFEEILLQTSLGSNEFLQKLLLGNIQNSSRMLAIEHNLNSFLSEPIFGVGINRAAAEMQHVADTSTSTYMMSIFGILGISYTVYWVYGIWKLPQISVMTKILLIAIALSILNKEPHMNLLLTWCLLFGLISGKVSDLEPEKPRKEKRKVIVWR